MSYNEILITRAGGRRVEVSALPLFFRIALNMQASIACVLELVTCHFETEPEVDM